MWLGLNVIVVGLLAGAISSMLLAIFKLGKIKPNGVVVSALAVVLTITAFFGVIRLIMQFIHVAPVAGSIHLAVGFLVAFIAAPSWVAWLHLERRNG